jgi:sulfide dehydrogenase cytochrome subunit
MANSLIRAALLCSGLLVASSGWAAGPSVSMLVGTCVGCHGQEGSSLGPAIPTIAGMSRNYFISAMLAYKYDNDPKKYEEILAADPSMKDVEKATRIATVMNRLAKGYSEEDIKAMADYFAAKPFVRVKQQVDAGKASSGKKLHNKYCEKCHEDGGKEAEGDAGVLAGQWKPYLAYTMTDFIDGKREMPKKMRQKVEELQQKEGDKAVEDLLHYYASQK